MKRTNLGRTGVASLAAAALLLTAVVANALASDAEHPVVGRWVVEAEPGGAVWAFQPSGALVASGPGDILSKGTWAPTAGGREFDAALDVAVTGQTLEVLGQVSEDEASIALYVTATEATAAEDWTPWPAESRLVGVPLGMMTEDTPEPTEPPLDCLRPEWIEGEVDWNRCDEVLTPA